MTNSYAAEEQKRYSPERIDPFLDDRAQTNIYGVKYSQTTGNAEQKRKRRWDVPTPSDNSTAVLKSKWDQEASVSESKWDKTPLRQETVNFGFSTPGGFFPPNLDLSIENKSKLEIDARNREWTDEALDSLLPSTGYAILEPPENYIPLLTPSRKLRSAPVSSMLSSNIDSAPPSSELALAGLPPLKPEDLQYFGKLMSHVDSDSMSIEEMKELKILKLLLQIKNGSNRERRSALRLTVEKAREFGTESLFDTILPIMMSPTLDEQERHILIKLVGRLIYRLDAMVRPFVHKILVVVEPLLIDEDYFVRTEGRDILCILAKASGPACIISAIRPDIDHHDEFVRNTTARAVSIVVSTLGMNSMLPFIQAICKSQKNWQARHTGLKIIQQTAILMGVGILPYVKDLIILINFGIDDEFPKVRTMSALALAALAEACYPHGKEEFSNPIEVLFRNIKKQKGKGLASFMKAFAQLCSFMDVTECNFYFEKIKHIFLDEYQSSDDELKRVVMTLSKILIRRGVCDNAFWADEVSPKFFKYCWNFPSLADRRFYNCVLTVTVSFSLRLGFDFMVPKLTSFLKHESETIRALACEATSTILDSMGDRHVFNEESKLEEQLIDSVLFAFTEISSDSKKVLKCIRTVFESIGKSSTKYLPQVLSMILWRLSNKTPSVRQYASDLASGICGVMKSTGMQSHLQRLSVVLYENFGEEYPDVLASIIKASCSIAQALGCAEMSPSVREILPRLTPILRNRHERVQEACVEYIGLIAKEYPDACGAKEWMRICFELLDLLKSPWKSTRRGAVVSFGHIAKAIGPSDVIIALLNNLKVQERQNRVCTTIAIAIVAESCGPFTILPALMNEYRVPELNVQNGVLKALSFLFEYIGEDTKNYIYTVATLLEDALTDRDLVHRQTACAVIKHAAVGSFTYGCEDVLLHLLNQIFPNIFETSPHLIMYVVECIECISLSIGNGQIMKYVMQGLFHPARRVREIYWRIYNNMIVRNGESLMPHYPSVSIGADNRETLIHCRDIVI